MDGTETNAWQRRTVAAGCLNRVGKGSLWRPLRLLIGHNNIQLQRNAFIHMRHVHSLCAFCNFIGETGESRRANSRTQMLCE